MMMLRAVAVEIFLCVFLACAMGWDAYWAD
jgi:hypothetical protein